MSFTMSSEEASAPSKSSSSASTTRSQLIERNRLGFREGDWNLPGAGTSSSSASCRTRHGGVGRPNLTKRNDEPPSTSSGDEDWSHASETANGLSSEDEEELEKAREKVKPPSSNIIVGVNALMEMLGKNCICQQCHGPVDVTIKTADPNHRHKCFTKEQCPPTISY
jgi:hypothetical protein